jgi:type IV pilus assembly protein PilB
MTGYNVEPVVASETAVIDAIAKYYGKGAPVEKNVVAPGASALELASKGLEEMQALGDAGDVEVLQEFEEISAEQLARQGEEAPVIKLVNVILMSISEARERHSSSHGKGVARAVRVDGILYNISRRR